MWQERLKILNLKDDEIKSFIYLLENGPIQAGELAKKISISRTSLYGYLKNMLSIGIITKSQKNGVMIFSPINQEKLDFIFEQKNKELSLAQKYITEIFENQKNKNKKIWQKPKFQIFEGPEEMQNLARDFLLYKNTETESYWPIKAMIEVLGESFFKEFNIERIKRNIWVNAIWPEKQKVDMKKYPFMGAGEQFLREIRIAPKDIDFSMGYWIYEDKVAFISSKKSNFGFIVENKEFTDMLRTQFKMIWKISKTLKIKNSKEKELFKKMIE